MLARLRSLSLLLDDAIPIPGTDYKIGLDPIIGLIPGAGDIVTGLMSAYIVVEAVKMGISRPTVFRMVVNILVEAVLGTFPILGDIFDTVWKSNLKNLALLEESLQTSDIRRKNDRFFMYVVILGLVILVLLFAAIPILVLSLVARLVS